MSCAGYIDEKTLFEELPVVTQSWPRTFTNHATSFMLGFLGTAAFISVTYVCLSLVWPGFETELASTLDSLCLSLGGDTFGSGTWMLWRYSGIAAGKDG